MSNLTDYLEDALGDSLSTELGWTSTGNDFDFIATETLDKLNLSAEPNPLTKAVKTIGKLKLWEAVLSEVSGDFDVSGDGASLRRSQVFDQIKQRYEIALVDALEFDPNYSIQSGSFDRTEDPYSNTPYYYRDL